MARKPKTKPLTQAPEDTAKSFDDDVEDGEAPDDEVPADPAEISIATKSRDWRDVERYKEMRELRKLVGDDIDFDIDVD